VATFYAPLIPSLLSDFCASRMLCVTDRLQVADERSVWQRAHQLCWWRPSVTKMPTLGPMDGFDVTRFDVTAEPFQSCPNAPMHRCCRRLAALARLHQESPLLQTAVIERLSCLMGVVHTL
jgi:hypothetical protein